MPAKIKTIEELAQALDAGRREFVLDGGLAELLTKCKSDGQAKVLAGLAERFDRGQAGLDRQLRKELGGDAPQKAKDLMREHALAAMEKLLRTVLAEVQAYDTKDGKLYVRR
jgi:hypothetical protein